MQYAFLNDELIESQKLSVPADDRGFLYGEAVFSTIRVYEEEPFLLEKHIARINSTLASQYIAGNFQLDIADIKEKIQRLVKKNKSPEAIVRLRVTAGCGAGPLRPENPKHNIIITISEFHFDEQLYETGVELYVTSVMRSKSSYLAKHKLGSYLECIVARNEAVKNWAYEGIIMSESGNVLECACSNIFAVKNKTLYAPPLSENILPGITRERVLECAQELSIKVVEEPFNLDFLKGADEVFITNSAVELLPVAKISPVDRSFSLKKDSITSRISTIYK